MVSTISNALQEGEQILKNAGIKNYKIEAREILENLLKMSFEEIFVQRDMFLKKQTKNYFSKEYINGKSVNQYNILQK